LAGFGGSLIQSIFAAKSEARKLAAARVEREDALLTEHVIAPFLDQRREALVALHSYFGRPEVRFGRDIEDFRWAFSQEDVTDISRHLVYVSAELAEKIREYLGRTEWGELYSRTVKGADGTAHWQARKAREEIAGELARCMGVEASAISVRSLLRGF